MDLEPAELGVLGANAVSAVAAAKLHGEAADGPGAVTERSDRGGARAIGIQTPSADRGPRGGVVVAAPASDGVAVDPTPDSTDQLADTTDFASADSPMTRTSSLSTIWTAEPRCWRMRRSDDWCCEAVAVNVRSHRDRENVWSRA